MQPFFLRSMSLVVALLFSQPGIPQNGIAQAGTAPAGTAQAGEPTGQDASSDERAVRQALQKYIQGTATNDPELTLSAFYEGADLFLSHPERPLWIMPIADYAERLGRRDRGKPNGRTGRVLGLDIHRDIATASAEITLPDGRRFIDLFLMKRLDGEWKILSKAATELD